MLTPLLEACIMTCPDIVYLHLGVKNTKSLYLVFSCIGQKGT